MNPISIRELLAKKLPKPKEYVEMLVQEGSNSFIYGREGSFKSFMAQDMALSIVLGLEWFGYKTTSGRVMLVNAELSEQLWQERWESFQVGKGIKICKSLDDRLLTVTDNDLKLDSMTGINELRQAMDKAKVEVVIVDNITSCFAGDITRNTDVSGFINGAKQISLVDNKTAVYVHHARQPQMDFRGRTVKQGTAEMFGSSFLSNWADTIVEVSKVSRDLIKMEVQKHRLAHAIPPESLLRFDRSGPKLDVDISIEVYDGI